MPCAADGGFADRQALDAARRRARCAGTPGCFCGLLVAAAAPAQAFDDAQPMQGSRARPGPRQLRRAQRRPTGWCWTRTGTAAWRAQGETSWRRFTRGEVLPPGAEIETGSDGEIMLVAGGDQLTIAPQGRLIVPLAQSGQDRRLRHERGHILVQIESRAARDVRIDTPLLSLGIKGTTIEVEVDPEQNSVVVHEGDAGGDDAWPGRPRGARGRRGSAPVGHFGRQPDALQRTGARQARRGEPRGRPGACRRPQPPCPERRRPSVRPPRADPAATRAQSDRTRAGGERAAPAVAPPRQRVRLAGRSGLVLGLPGHHRRRASDS